MIVQIDGSIGPFLDNVQQRQVEVVVSATCEFTAASPPDTAHVQAQLLRAIRDVIAPKMANGQLSFRHLGTGDTAAILPEIIAGSGLAAQGVQVGSLNMAFGIDGRPPQVHAPKPAASAVPEVRANLHIGGLNIKASSKGGIDGAGLANQLADKAKSAMMWWAFGAFIILLVVVGLALLGLYIKNKATEAVHHEATAASWDGKKPLVCSANESLTVHGVTANLPGTAITASGNCNLTLTDVDITAGTGIEASGNAVVTVHGGKVTGSALAAHAAGNSKVHFTGTKVTGKTKTSDLGKVNGP